MTHAHTLPHTTNLTERVLRVRFCLQAYPFLRSFFLQITTGITKTDTALPDTMTEETATVVIETGTEIVTKDGTETEGTTGTVIDGTTTDDLEGTTEEQGEGEEGIDENARKGLAQGAKTTCKLTALQRVTVATVRGDGALNVAGMVWALRNEGALRQQTQSHCL